MDHFKLVSFDGKQCSAYIGYKDGKILLSAWYTFEPERDKLFQEFLDGKPQHSVPLDKFLSVLGIPESAITAGNKDRPMINSTPVPCVLCGVEPGTFHGEDLCTKGLLCPECDGSKEGLKTFSKYEDAVSDWNKRQEKVLKALPLAKRCERLQALLDGERRVSQWREAQAAEKDGKLQAVISACTTKAWEPGSSAANLAEKIVDIATGR